jgi:FixJ family two-component response regulator
MRRSSLISVVDDDVSSRESLPDLLQTFGFAAVSFASAEAFLASDVLADTRCLILDVSMPGMSGPELQCELTRRALKIPIVFMTARCDEVLRADLLARGAVDCLFKPFSDHDLRSALARAVGKA